jgi:hypothetical protein
MIPYIAAELEWKSLSSPQPAELQVETTTATWGRSPQLLGQLNLEITLSTKLVEYLRPPKSKLSLDWNEHFLLDDAFRPKVYTVRIEKGDFIAPSGIGRGDGPYTTRPRYALRLLFVKSPFPPREDWRSPEGGPDSTHFWDYVEFAGRPSPELEKRWRAPMNDPDSASWSSCVVT